MKTFIINLPHREDRLTRSKTELKAFFPETWSATSSINGAFGLMTSLRDCMKRCLKAGWYPVLICEDDIRLLYDGLHTRKLVEEQLTDMPFKWQQLYLGANIEKTKSLYPIGETLLKVKYAKALHACVYSEQGLRAVLELGERIPIDEVIAEELHPNGHAYIMRPMLAVQYPGYSDIREKNVNYNFMLKRYEDGIEE